MKVEFFGSMLVFATALFLRPLRHRWIIYLAASRVFINYYYLAFIIGMVFADLFANKTQAFKTSNKSVLSTMLLVGLFFGSYPVGTLTHDSLYGFLNRGFFFRPFIGYHILGAGLIMYVLLNSTWLQKVFSSAFSVFLGEISYSLYLIHFLVICSFTCKLFLILYPILPYGTALLISMIVSSALIFPLSYLFYTYIDTAGVKLSKKVYNRFLSPLLYYCEERLKQQHTLSSIHAIYDSVRERKLCWFILPQVTEQVHARALKTLFLLKTNYLQLLKCLFFVLISLFLKVIFDTT